MIGKKKIHIKDFVTFFVASAVESYSTAWREFKLVNHGDIGVEDKVGESEIFSASIGNVLAWCRQNLSEDIFIEAARLLPQILQDEASHNAQIGMNKSIPEYMSAGLNDADYLESMVAERILTPSALDMINQDRIRRTLMISEISHAVSSSISTAMSLFSNYKITK